MSILDRFRKKPQTPDEPEVSPLFATDAPEDVPERRTSDEMIEEMFDKVSFEDQSDPIVRSAASSEDISDNAAEEAYEDDFYDFE